MSLNTLEYANQLQAENEQLKRKLQTLENDLKLSSETLKNANEVVLAAKAKFDQFCVDNDALQEQVRALASENAALKDVFGQGEAVLNFLAIALRHTTYDEIDLNDVALAFKMSLPESPATDAAIREIQAQGCEMFIEFNRKLAKDYPTAMVAKALEVTELNGEQFAARIRAGEDDKHA